MQPPTIKTFRRDNSCQSNLKQIGLGLAQYTQDYDEKYPSSSFTYNNPGAGPAQATWDTVIQPYMKSAQIIRCSSDAISAMVNHPLYGANASRSYSATYQIFGSFDFNTPPLSLAAIPATALTVVVAERDQPNLGSWSSYSFIQNLGSQVNFRHLETSNILFCDGHVKAMRGKNGGPYPNLPDYSLFADGSPNCDYNAQLPQG